MYPLVAFFVGLSAAGLLMIIRASISAPEGYEDANGFHALHQGEMEAYAPTDSIFGLDDLLSAERQLASQVWH